MRPQKENWDADSALSPDEQMRHIFARFLELPLPARQVPPSLPQNEHPHGDEMVD